MPFVTAPTEYLTTRKAADLLGCSVATVHRLEADGKLPVAMKVDGLRGPKMFRRTDVEALKTEDAS
jgi:excisionase family DNA binding protein